MTMEKVTVEEFYGDLTQDDMADLDAVCAANCAAVRDELLSQGDDFTF